MGSYNQKAMSLIEVMISLAIMSIVGMLFTQMISNRFRMNKKNALDSEKQELKMIFSRKFDCSITSCLSLKKKISEYRIGRWHFRSVCKKNDLYVYTLKYRKDHKEPINDPIHRKKMTWSPLFTADKGFYCSSYVDKEENSYEGNFYQNKEYNKANNTRKHQLKIEKLLEKKLEQEIKKICPEGQELKSIDTKTLEIICE